MIKLLAAAAALALPACLIAEDFQPAAPAVRVATHENDWQKVLAKLKKYGGDIGSEEMPIFGIASLRGPEKGEHLADYLEYMGNELFYINSEDWTSQVDPKLARRIIEKKPGVFWRIFSAWPADASAEPRVAAFLRRHPELKPVLADRKAPMELQNASKLLGFLDAHPDLFKKYSHFDIYVDQWLFRHDGPNLEGCTHYLLVEDRKTLTDSQEQDPEVGCGPAAVAKHKQVLQYWMDYEPAHAAAPAPETPPAHNPLTHRI